MLPLVFCTALLAQGLNYSAEFDFGYLWEGMSAAQTPYAAKHLELEREQLLEIGRLNKQLKRSDRTVGFNKALGEIRRSNAGAKNLYDLYQQETKLVEECNDEVLDQIDKVIDSPAKSREFRRVLTIYLLQVGSVEAVLRVNNVKLNQHGYERLLALLILHKENKRDAREFVNLSSLRSLGNLLSDEEISSASGEEYRGTLPGEGSVVIGNPIQQYFNSSALRLASNPKVQAELKMTVEQIGKLNSQRARLENDFGDSAARRLTFGGGMPHEVISKLTKLRKDLDREIAALITATQHQRLDQLLFQLHVRNADHAWALKYAGKEAPVNPKRRAKIQEPVVNDGMKRSLIHTEARYASAATSIRDHMKILVEIVGHGKAMGMVGGRLTLPNSTTRKKEGNEEVRRIVERAYLGEFSKPPASPRRRADG